MLVDNENRNWPHPIIIVNIITPSLFPMYLSTTIPPIIGSTKLGKL